MNDSGFFSSGKKLHEEGRRTSKKYWEDRLEHGSFFFSLFLNAVAF